MYPKPMYCQNIFLTIMKYLKISLDSYYSKIMFSGLVGRPNDWPNLGAILALACACRARLSDDQPIDR